jgi:glycosyltransferase involved in cell wall biosynthesis
LQATSQGQASYAHVHEIVEGLEEIGWHVDLFDVDYADRRSPSPGRRLMEFARVQARLIRRIRSYGAVYVRSHPLAYPVTLAARASGVATIQECNGPFGDVFAAWPATRLLGPMVVWLQAAQYRMADAVIAVDDTLARWLERACGVQGVCVVPNGANVELFRPDITASFEGLPERYAVFFGTLAVWQGLEVMIEAAGSPRWPEEVGLVIVGDGVLAETVERAAESNPRVVYLGRRPYAQIPAIVSRALCSLVVKDSDLHAQTGLSPLKVHESMACGVPVVASDVPGMDSIIRSADAGILTRRGDADEVARAVARLAADPDAARAMGCRGRESAVAEHSWKARSRSTAEVILTAMSRAYGGGRDV